MQTYYIKADSEADLWSELEAAGVAEREYDMDDPANSPPADLGEDEVWSGPSGAFEWRSLVNMLDIIGTIYVETGETLTDSEGNEYPAMSAIDGYHANLRADLTAEQIAELTLIDAPSTPYRKWAGDE